NLANVQPRQTISLSLACANVETVYHAIMKRIADSGGRIVTSSLAGSDPANTTANNTCESPDGQADAAMNDLRPFGFTLHVAVSENSDSQNVTGAKRGFAISLLSSDAVNPKQTTTLEVSAGDPAGAMNDLKAAALASGGRVVDQNISKREAYISHLVVEVPL